jgi:hypothetical protein
VMTACFSSLTSPEIEPEVCANAGQQSPTSNARVSINSFVALVMRILPFVTTGGLSFVVNILNDAGPENADEVLNPRAKLRR